MLFHLFEASAGGAERLVVAVEDDVFAQLTLERAVEQLYLLRRGEAYLLEVFFVVADDPGVVACEHAFEFLAYRLIEAVHVVDADAFAVGRVCDEHAAGLSVDAGAWRFVPLGDGFDLEVDVAAHAGALDVGLGDGHGARRDVGAEYFEVDLALVGVVVVEAVKQLGVKVFPLFKGEAFAVDAGVDVGGDQGGFYQECA